MSEPKTVRDRYDYTDRIPEADGRAEGECWCFYPDNTILDYHIIPGANAVVTPQGLEDAAAAMADVYAVHPHSGYLGAGAYKTKTEAQKVKWRNAARAALEAARIEVVDVVVEVKNEEGHIQHTAHKDDAEYSYIHLAPGDTLFIHRKENTNDQG